MKRFYRERFEAQQRLLKKLATTLEVNNILGKIREEVKILVPSAMEACVLMLDADALEYTRPMECALYDGTVNCLSCKRDRTAVQKALDRRKGIVIYKSEPILRQDGTVVETGPEAAIPVFVRDEILAVINVVSRPGTRFTKKDFYLIKDLSEMAGNFILNAEEHWKMAQDKIRISRMLNHLSPFVPQSVRNIVEENPETPRLDKKRLEVTVLFLDLEGYTRLSSNRSDTEVNEIVEKIFSSFVDPIHRSGGDINETAGDGLMIIFKDGDARTNAINAVKAAFDIYDINQALARRFKEKQEPIQVNMGINSGTALVGMTRFKGALETRMTYTASGPVTNIAARLADLAIGGDILIGETTKELIKDIWPAHYMGEKLLKSMETPLNVYSLKEMKNLWCPIEK
ncbi:adenylate/guanylate cyclase domain-containing protein [Thermodesulfobacteriota bacterium]